MSWGIHSSRILFAPRLKKFNYYSLLSCSDLFLDTRYYGSHTVTSDAMWGGLPVLTLQGDSFSSRVASSLNFVANLNYLIVHHRRQYVDVAVYLLQHLIPSFHLKNEIFNVHENGKLFNPKQFSFGLESIYSSMMNMMCLHQQHSNTEHFHIFLSASSIVL
jgi:predicted O-linked N-acetylglucosamine transferase (SPINDLY family)